MKGLIQQVQELFNINFIKMKKSPLDKLLTTTELYSRRDYISERKSPLLRIADGRAFGFLYGIILLFILAPIRLFTEVSPDIVALLGAILVAIYFPVIKWKNSKIEDLRGDWFQTLSKTRREQLFLSLNRLT